ncbi:MAG: hypothetical protein IPM54_29720 [Polyangiaceae bacterium]|nr:hypothetical protein [Polyangiaceae bacterium]
MASVNPLSRELVFKVVYYGPGLGGKTTTLEYIHATAKPDHRGKLVSLATPVDRTLYFDFLPMRLPPIRGMHVRLQLFTVPGQVYFNATRKLVLTGADGIVFVADSQTARADANLESLDNLRDNLADQGRNLSDVPIVFQYNKHDLPDVLPVEELDKLLNRWRAASLATSAKTGLGVYEGLEKITHAVLASFETQMPESVRVAAAAAFDPNEEGLAAALRGASQAEDRPPTSGAIFNRVASSRTALGSIPPETGVEDGPSIEKAAMRPAALPVMTFPENTDDGSSSKDKLALAAASEPSILTKPDSIRAHTGRGPDSRSGESPRSRSRPSVLPPKPYAPIIPHAAQRTSVSHASHAPPPPPNATTTAVKEPAPHAAAPAPPPNATTTAVKEAAPAVAKAPSASAVASASASSAAPAATEEKAPSTEKTIAAPAKPAAAASKVETAPAKAAPAKAEPAPAKAEPALIKVEPTATKAEPAPIKVEPAKAPPTPIKAEHAPIKIEIAAEKTQPAVAASTPAKTPAPFEKLDPTELFSIADLLEPAPEAVRQPPTETPQAKARAAETPAPADAPRAQTEPKAAEPLPVAKRIAAEPEPAPAVEAPKPIDLEPLPIRKSTPPPAAVAKIEEAAAPAAAVAKAEAVATPPAPPPAATAAPARATPTPQAPAQASTAAATTASAPAKEQPEAPLPPPPPPPPARPLGAIPTQHAHVESNRPDAHAAVPSTSKGSSETNLVPAPAAHVEKSEARKTHELSFGELWPESDRALVHEAEAALAAGRCAEAIDHADALVTRVLTGAATLFGSSDPSRDMTNMPLMLGIDGRRYLAFRSIVRACRSGAKPSMRDALAAYAFAIEARMAKSSVR